MTKTRTEDDVVHERGGLMPTKGVLVDPAMLAPANDVGGAVISLKGRKSKKDSKAHDAWKVGLIGDDEPIKCLANVMHVFAKHPAWEGVIAYDAFLQCVVKRRPPPVREQDGCSAVGEWTEQDGARAVAWFASNVGFEPSTTQVEQAAAAVGEQTIIHPVRDYLGGLAWDRVPRLPAVALFRC